MQVDAYGRALSRKQLGDVMEALWVNKGEVYLRGIPSSKDRLMFRSGGLRGGLALYVWTVIDLGHFEGSISQKFSWVHVGIHAGTVLSSPETYDLMLVWDTLEQEYYWKSEDAIVATDVIMSIDSRFDSEGTPIRMKKIKLDEVVRSVDPTEEELLKLAEAVRDKVDSTLEV
jgi:hypothetical protein